MTRTTKKWAGIALSAAVVFLFLFQRKMEDARMQGMWEQKYHRTRMQIGWQLMHLRHGYGTRQMPVSQNTMREIGRLWEDRDVLFHLLRHRKSAFSADSLNKLKSLINRRAPLTTVLGEIERIEKANETN